MRHTKRLVCKLPSRVSVQPTNKPTLSDKKCAPKPYDIIMYFLVLSLTNGFQCLASTCLIVPSFTSKLYLAWQYLLGRQSLGIINQVGRLTRQGLRGSIDGFTLSSNAQAACWSPAQVSAPARALQKPPETPSLRLIKPTCGVCTTGCHV